MNIKQILGLSFFFFLNGLNAQVNSIYLLYNSTPGIGCHSNMSVCLITGTLPESGAEVIVDWMDGSLDTLMAYSGPNSENCYVFEHDYSQAGVYNALVTVTSGTAGGQLVGSETIEWVITNTAGCGFFTLLSLLSPTVTVLSAVPYDVVDNAGVLTTIYPKNSFGNPYYTELNVANVPYTVSVNDAWLQSNGYAQVSPDFTITSFDLTGRAENTPMNMTLQCVGTGNTPNLELTAAAAFQFLAPLEKGNVHVEVCNVSCGNMANSTIKIAIPQGVTPNLTAVPNASFANDTVTVLVPYLNACFSVDFPCAFAGSTPAGTVFNFYATASAVGEQDFMFNASPFVTTVLNSYDPNDKQCNLPRYIQPGVTEKLQFTVRFQNDGNYPALNVVIRDTISTNLDLSTFRFIGSKHPVTYTINSATREVVFRFSGINLVPSAENLDASQGFFTYAVNELTNLPLDAEVRNTAYIYFDFNPAIVTNTTVNTNAYLGLSAHELERVNVFPNPTHGKFTLDLPEGGLLKVYSVSGSLVYEGYVSKHQLVDLTQLEKGMYHIQVSLSKGVFTHKLVLE